MTDTVAHRMTEQATDHRRATADRNRVAILDAAEALLERRAGVSIAAVASEAGVSRPTVYAHYATLEDLLTAIVARAVAGSEEVLASAAINEGTAMEALERLITVGWGVLERHRAMAQAAAEQLSPEALRQTHDSANRLIADLIARGREDGSFRTDLPAEWLVTSMHVLFHAAGDDVRAGRLDQSVALPVLTTTLRDLLAGGPAAAPPR